jgi:hypothetical protein
MRIVALALVGVVGTGLVVSALAATPKAPKRSWHDCHSETMAHGLSHHQHGAKEHMKHCIAGKTK